MTQYFDLAEYYDHDQDFDFDLAFYKEYARHCSTPILELACGSGRLTIPLAKAGFELYGLDNSAAMLDRCQTAVSENNLQNQVHLTLGDMSAFDLPKKDFDLIFIPLRSFMHLLTREEQVSCLHHIHHHLQPGGLCIIDVIAPDLQKLTQKADGKFFIRREFSLPNGNQVLRQIRLNNHDRVNQVRNFEFQFEEFDPAGNLQQTYRVPVSTRYIFRYELQLLLESAGFEIVDVFREYDKTPYDGTGEMIVVSRRI